MRRWGNRAGLAHSREDPEESAGKVRSAVSCRAEGLPLSQAPRGGLLVPVRCCARTYSPNRAARAAEGQPPQRPRTYNTNSSLAQDPGTLPWLKSGVRLRPTLSLRVRRLRGSGHLPDCRDHREVKLPFKVPGSWALKIDLR